MNKPNTSVLQCPECKKALVNIGSKVERIHPIARFVKDCYMWIVFSWVIFILIIGFVAMGGGGGVLGLGYGMISILMVPFVVNYFLLRAFPLYRVTDCPYCGFHEKQRLGHSHSGEY